MLLHHPREVGLGHREESAWAGTLPFPRPDWAAYFAYQQSEADREPGSGVWLATDYDWSADTFDADVAADDLDDKLILQRRAARGEGVYNLPSAAAGATMGA